jgi:hypothetical protein
MQISKITDDDLTVIIETNERGSYECIAFSENEQSELYRHSDLSLSEAVRRSALVMIAEYESADSPSQTCESVFRSVCIDTLKARAHDSAINVKYIASTVSINDDNEATFDARVTNIETADSATHGNLTISLDLLSLLLSDDERVQRETLAMLRDLHMQQFDGQFYDDERDNLKHCIA